MVRIATFVVVLGGCVSSSSVVCDDGTVCPIATVCDVVHHGCVTPDQISECAGMPDRTGCAMPQGSGTCHDGVCLPAACGNGRLDLVEDEACDDGNTIDGDGCSGNCKSDETCGNHIVDAIKGELCDDGNRRDHDGCSSACELETLDWTQLADPGPRTDMRGAYDVARDQVVMYGGTVTVSLNGAIQISTAVSEWAGIWHGNLAVAPPPTQTGFAVAYDRKRQVTVLQGGTVDLQHGIPDTYEWDGRRWSRGPDGPPIIDAAMAYDAHRHVMVLFGGRDTTGNIGNTWEYDGTAWKQVSPATTPAARSAAAMTFDPVRGVIVMYGGVFASATNEIWEYDGTTWTNRTPASGGPFNLDHPALAYSSALHRVVLHGGFVGANPMNAMWLWDGTTWTAFVGTTPTARGAHMMVEDGRGGLLLYGGRTGSATTSNNVLQDTWLFDGAAWSLATAPSPRQDFVIADAIDEGKVVMFGGRNGATFFAETWELTNRGWKLGTPGPLDTDLAVMVHDSLHRQFVLFGGAKNAGATLDDTTWLRTGPTWASSHPTPSPALRAGHGMAFDAAHGVTVLFGGFTTGNVPLNDTWTFDGTVWKQLAPPHSPSVRFGVAMAYDPVHGVVVMWGGGTAGAPLDDTWIWDGTDWQQATVTSTTHPSGAHLGPSFVWDAAHQGLVLAGGAVAFVDVFEAWQWTASGPATGRWDRLATIQRPSGRAFQGAFTSLDGSGITLFGGASAFLNNTVFNDVWRLRDDGPRANDACRLALDVDRDALTACSDPDCWPVCMPDCPPGVSCPATARQCGDGTCSPLESCHSCPQDCTSCTPVCGDGVCDPGETCPGDC